MSGRYVKLFERLANNSLAKNSEGAFIPFVMLGDPGMAESEGVIETLIEGGADALALGVPFSDPTADGPEVQAAAKRALDSGAAPDKCLDILSGVRKRHEDIPIGLYTYANIVIGGGAERFYRRAAEAGADSILVLDVPVISSRPFASLARGCGLEQAFIAPSNASGAHLREIAAAAEGYIHLMSVGEAAGADSDMAARLSSKISVLKDAGAPPVLAESEASPEHVRLLLEAGADGVILSSAVSALIAANLSDAKKMRGELLKFAQTLKAAAVKH